MRTWLLKVIPHAIILGILTLTIFLVLPSNAAAFPVAQKVSAAAIAKQTKVVNASTQLETHKLLSEYKPKPAWPTYYRVKPNDTLGSIAAKLYGSVSYWPVIYRANKSKITNPNVIFQRQKLKIPRKPKHLPSIPSFSVTNQAIPPQGRSIGSPPVSGAAGKAVAFVYAQLGCPYVWGGNGPCSSGFDCSGLMQQAWLYAGISIPRVSYDIMAQEPAVSLQALEPGDILGMYGNGHVGMYVGHGLMIDAPVPGAVVEKVSVPWGAVDGAVRP